MGQIAEKMAKENGITRAAQDDYAHLSHTRAARAFEAGFMDGYVMRMYLPPSFAPVTRDNLVRFDSTRAAYDKLSPVFDRAHGTVTAGTSSALSDGASALLLMSEPRAKERNLAPLGYVRSFAFAALDPRGQTLMGPAYATPIALRRAGLELSDVDLIDVHEAFAAQVLSNIQAFESEAFARVELNLVRSIGKVDLERLNVLGGSIAMGHPFAATGGRQIVQTLSELRRRGLQFGLCTTCAAGGLGAAMVLEAA
jgi:acetyl-CoA acyltransferase